MKVLLEEILKNKKIESSYLESSLTESLNYHIKKPINVTFLLEHNKDRIFLNLKGKTELLFTCDRCLEQFPYQLELDEKSVINLSDFSEKQELDITEELRQNVSLSIPDKKLCKNTCKGLCPECGKNLNLENCNCKKTFVNPKFEKLKELKIQNNPK